VITAVATIAPYLVRLPGRTGWYFQRKVPADLVSQVGTKLWRWKAGNTPQEARKAVVEGLTKTDEIIGQLRGEITPEPIKAIEQRPIRGLLKDLQEQGITPQDYGLDIALRTLTGWYRYKQEREGLLMI
jgi:hypothetical protein